MDRKITDARGFTLVEIVITITIIAILAGVAMVKYREISFIHEIHTDLDQMIAFLQKKRLKAFTQKTAITITVTPNQLTSNPDGDMVDMKNNFTGSAGTFSINSRGLFSTTGNIHLTSNPGTQYSCVVMDNSSVREGQWDGATCTAK